ncbi:PAS domain-containing protein [Marivirga salinae]|uniref:PAS domain-containing protein n=1 Tax=Marivirga salinarum TaxID=3059078 RepID=A0AA51NA57_9BACT|nr:PAS domain-containing protein [Marivirga sp. BDSF4-3]WMN11383.1 PAS domain-containing protein [Marivirga sp. BDSF4-3]
MIKYQNNLSNMMCLDIYLMDLSPQEYHKMHTKILDTPKDFKNVLHCHDIAAMSNANVLSKIKIDLSCLEKYAQRNRWQENIQKILKNPFEALVLTNLEKEILWVNSGFEAMTGFKAQEAVGLTPTFLQGKNTDSNTRSIFRQKLQEDRNFSISIKNYRKNGEEYDCKVDIFPLHDSENRISHFLALEQEIR